MPAKKAWVKSRLCYFFAFALVLREGKGASKKEEKTFFSNMTDFFSEIKLLGREKKSAFLGDFSPQL